MCSLQARVGSAFKVNSVHRPSLSWLSIACLLLLLTRSSQAEHVRGRDLQPGGINLVSPLQDDNFIIGGSTVTDPTEFPFYVKFEGGVLCGGSLISPNRVMTAAHCVSASSFPSQVRIGATTTSNGKVYPVRCAVQHPDYLSPLITVINDVAILKLDVDVPDVEFVQLNSNASFPAVSGTDLTVIGFGLTRAGSTSNTLQKVGTHYVTTEECYSNYDATVVKPDAHMCGDVTNAGDCNGDSGGPLMDTATGVQVGIVSFGYGGCASSYQDVYTRVSTYYDWIQEQMDDDTCPTGGLAEVPGGIFSFLRSMGYLMVAWSIQGIGWVGSLFTGGDE